MGLLCLKGPTKTPKQAKPLKINNIKIYFTPLKEFSKFSGYKVKKTMSFISTY